MPTNLPPEARAKWAKYLEARSPEEKLMALEEYLSAIPKHKGTENLRAWVRRKIAELKEEIREKRIKKASGRGVSFFVGKEGAAQVVLIGLPNSGKSAILRRLTNAKPEISDVPFTTKYPTPGMLKFEDIQFQLVEAPSIVEGASKGKISWGLRVLGLARNSDALVLVLDASRNISKQLDILINELKGSGIYLSKPRGEIKVLRNKGIQGVKIVLLGRIVDGSLDDLRKMLNLYKVHNVEVKIIGRVSIKDIEKSILERRMYKPAVIVLNKVDLLPYEEVQESLELIKGKVAGVPAIPVSALKNVGLAQLPSLLFRSLRIIRVYTKEPNSAKPSEKPIILNEGSTVADAAKRIREELLRFFKYARIWGPSAKYPGERVGLDHVLKDKDVIEIRTKVKGI